MVICGGGLAGASAAIRLARAGRPVVVLERERQPAHKLCGEFLSGEALADLREVGVDPASLGAAPIGGMRLVHRGRVAESRLPFPAAGLSRLVLDEALLARAEQAGAEIRRGVRVRSAGAEGVSTDGGALAASSVLLATGKHALRGHPRPAPREELVGLKMHLRLRPQQQAALAGFVEVILFRGGYAGLQLVEDGIANLCLLVAGSRFEHWASLLDTLTREEPHLALRLAGAVACWQRPLSIARVPYGFVFRGQDPVFRLGDQAAVIPSFCGDGMAIALHSARLAAQAILAGQGAYHYHAAMAQSAGPPVRLAYNLYRATRADLPRRIAVAAASRWPAAMRYVARRTRIAQVTPPPRPYAAGHCAAAHWTQQ